MDIYITQTNPLPSVWGKGRTLPNFMETTLANYQTQMETYITQIDPEATVGEVLGTQTIIPVNRRGLSMSMPYKLIAKGAIFKELPQNLRHHFKFNLYHNETARILDNPALSLTKSLPELAGKRLTFSFEPALESDRQVIESYLPEVPEGQELDPNDLPTSLPGYLIHLKAQLKLDGEIKAESGTFTMGEELVSTTGITRLTGGWHSANNKPIAGEFYAFGLDLAGISAKQLETVKERMETVKTQLETQQFDGLTKDGIIGDMLYAGALSYFAANDVNLKMLNRVGKAIAYRQPSFGTFSTSLDPVYSFGIPRQVEMGGIMVDMDAVTQSLWAKDNDVQVTRTIGQQVGMMTSALEHEIPELLFTNDEHPGEAVSAVKALTIASASGQRIYHVTKDNVNAVLPVLNISVEVKDEIRDSVAVGKVATVSQNNITVGNWTGVGYIITDPQTGAGAYRISGGMNGAIHFMERLIGAIIALISFAGKLLLAGIFGLLLFLFFFLVTLLTIIGFVALVLMAMAFPIHIAAASVVLFISYLYGWNINIFLVGLALFVAPLSSTLAVLITLIDVLIFIINNPPVLRASSIRRRGRVASGSWAFAFIPVA